MIMMANVKKKPGKGDKLVNRFGKAVSGAIRTVAELPLAAAKSAAAKAQSTSVSAKLLSKVQSNAASKAGRARNRRAFNVK